MQNIVQMVTVELYVLFRFGCSSGFDDVLHVYNSLLRVPFRITR